MARNGPLDAPRIPASGVGPESELGHHEKSSSRSARVVLTQLPRDRRPEAASVPGPDPRVGGTSLSRALGPLAGPVLPHGRAPRPGCARHGFALCLLPRAAPKAPRSGGPRRHADPGRLLSQAHTSRDVHAVLRGQSVSGSPQGDSVGTPSGPHFLSRGGDTERQPVACGRAERGRMAGAGCSEATPFPRPLGRCPGRQTSRDCAPQALPRGLAPDRALGKGELEAGLGGQPRHTMLVPAAKRRSPQPTPHSSRLLSL